jgi:hypothetical protein
LPPVRTGVDRTQRHRCPRCRRITNALTVAVEDSRSGLSFEVPAPAEKALDVFEHPYAYA